VHIYGQNLVYSNPVTTASEILVKVQQLSEMKQMVKQFGKDGEFVLLGDFGFSSDEERDSLVNGVLGSKWKDVIAVTAEPETMYTIDSTKNSMLKKLRDRARVDGDVRVRRDLILYKGKSWGIVSARVIGTKLIGGIQKRRRKKEN